MKRKHFSKFPKNEVYFINLHVCFCEELKKFLIGCPLNLIELYEKGKLPGSPVLYMWLTYVLIPLVGH